MAKKLIKYGKFLMSVALIFCLMAPSYAALSNTDGSAFVTKAEFDSALSDFNGRMTSFEAGINSQIDSQVSLYLDRNGIWSGKPQTINSTTSLQTFNVKNLKTFENVHKTAKIFESKVINKLNKSGLCYVTWSYWCPSPTETFKSGQGMSLLPGAGNSTGHNAWNFDLIYTQNSIVRTIQSIVKCNCVRIIQGGTAQTTLYGLWWYVPKNPYIGTTMFFADRDMDVTATLQLSYYLNYGSWDANWSSDCNWSFDSVIVY